jgi:hypothetical protein
MTPEASQTVPEKPRDRVSVEENDVPSERDCDWKPEEGVQELGEEEVQEFRSYRSSGVAESRRNGGHRRDTVLNSELLNSCNS